MIVTLAGHVDHGKTSLVRALTGVDTDSLIEEKRRGLTIDLGFAYLKTPQQLLGFVDVPGHHRFIHNMVAGVASGQHALLVIAADDGPMPQSREHLQILDLLGVRSGTIALTKCDRVSKAQIDAARAGIAQLVKGSFLQSANIIETSITSGAGIAELQAELLQFDLARSSTEVKQSFRLAIDRAFAVTGAGVVVTGTVHAGRVATDDTLSLFPSGDTVRVKSVRAQDTSVTSARAGDRCALNISGVAMDQVTRGQWLCGDPDRGVSQFAVELRVLADFPRALRHWLPVHLYHATSHTTAHIAVLSEGRIEPGTSTLVELITAQPLAVHPGDRLILRDQGLDRTLGGGRVISRQRPEGRRRDPERLQRLAADNAQDAATAFASHLALGTVNLSGFKDNWGCSDSELAALVNAQQARVIEGHAIAGSLWQRWRESVRKEIVRLHTADPSLQGTKQSALDGSTPDRFLGAVLAELVSAGELVVTSGRYAPADHQVALSAEESRLLSALLPHLDQPQPPSLGDLSKQVRIPIAALSRGLVPLVSKKLLVRISDNRFYAPGQIMALAETARELGARGPFSARDFRDAAGIGRNVAIELLEYFDRRAYTRRQGDLRNIVGEPNRVLG
ncbi:MAG: selenocysteine-specific translation elongation factor [Pseudomonadales bacterium]|nr:selenocysteine-specific translation elongation factor [Pseudomonadales bacterium]